MSQSCSAVKNHAECVPPSFVILYFHCAIPLWKINNIAIFTVQNCCTPKGNTEIQIYGMSLLFIRSENNCNTNAIQHHKHQSCGGPSYLSTYKWAISNVINKIKVSCCHMHCKTKLIASYQLFKRIVTAQSCMGTQGSDSVFTQISLAI